MSLECTCLNQSCEFCKHSNFFLVNNKVLFRGRRTKGVNNIGYSLSPTFIFTVTLHRTKKNPIHYFMLPIFKLYESYT